MSYNLYNLFDCECQIVKKDWKFYPLKFKKSSAELIKYYQTLEKYKKKEFLALDWNEEVVEKKIKMLARVIKEISPDILVLQEVENKKVLDKLISLGLKEEGYLSSILLEGEDVRGINIAIISKYKPCKEAKLHNITQTQIENTNKLELKKTRGILEVSFNIEGKVITILGNHWPSFFNDQALKDQASQLLSKLFQKNAMNSSKSNLIIAAGDFNTSQNIVDQLNTKHKLQIKDCYDEHFKIKNNSTITKGTFYFKEAWFNFDRILVLNNDENIISEYENFNIIFKDFMKKNKTSHLLNLFNSKKLDGYSDHLPVVMYCSISPSHR